MYNVYDVVCCHVLRIQHVHHDHDVSTMILTFQRNVMNYNSRDWHDDDDVAVVAWIGCKLPLDPYDGMDDVLLLNSTTVLDQAYPWFHND